MTHLLDPADVQHKLAWLLTRKLQMRSTLSQADVVLTHFEVNDRHGTGVLLRKIFGASRNLLCIRTYSYYDHENYLGDASFALAHDGLTRPEIYANVLRALNGTTVRRIVCVPFFAHEAWTAIALRDLFDVPLCTYIMDDRNIHEQAIPDVLLRELLAKSALRFVISPEMRTAYESKYQQAFWLLPPVVSRHLMPDTVQTPAPEAYTSRAGVLVGNIKSQKSLTLLRQTIRGTGATVHWYGDVEKSLRFTEQELRADGLVYCGFIPQQQLAATLAKYLYAILPSSSLDEASSEDETVTARAIARLSWPSRISFILATSHTPILVLGSRETAAARIVERLHVGTTAAYEPGAFARAVSHLTTPAVQHELRQRAASLADHFSAEGVADWIWASLECGEPCDSRFERFMPR